MAKEKDTHLSDEDFVAQIGAVYEQVHEARKNDEYVVNQPQMEKFDELLRFFVRKASEFGDKITKVNVDPINSSGCLTAHFIVLCVSGSEVAEFCKVMSYCSSFDIGSVRPDGITISCAVPDVYVRVKNTKD